MTGKLRDTQTESSRQEGLFRQEQIYGCREADKHTSRFKQVDKLIDREEDTNSKERMLGMHR